MAQRNLRNLLVPAPDDLILTSLSQTLAEAGVYVPVASAAAARLLLTQMETAGQTPTPATPLMLLVGSGAQRNAYIADGSKNSGTWVLQALNEVEGADDTYDTSWSGYKSFSVATGVSSRMMKSKLPARPYARRVNVNVAAYGKKIAGRPTLMLTLHDGRRFHSRFDADGDTASCQGQCVIPAGEAPDITVAIFGAATGTNTVELTGNEDQNSLMVTALPVTMS